jgi:hypothetical protein
MPAHLRKRHVGGFLKDRMDQPGMRLDPARASVAALGLRREGAGAAAFGIPSDRRRWGNPEPRSRRPTAETIINSRNHPRP